MGSAPCSTSATPAMAGPQSAFKSEQDPPPSSPTGVTGTTPRTQAPSLRTDHGVLVGLASTGSPQWAARGIGPFFLRPDLRRLSPAHTRRPPERSQRVEHPGVEVECPGLSLLRSTRPWHQPGTVPFLSPSTGARPFCPRAGRTEMTPGKPTDRLYHLSAYALSDNVPRVATPARHSV